MTASFTQAVLTPHHVRRIPAASRIDTSLALQIDVRLDDGRVVPLRLADARQVRARIADIAAWLPQLASVTLRKRSRLGAAASMKLDREDWLTLDAGGGLERVLQSALLWRGWLELEQPAGYRTASTSAWNT